MPKVTTFLTFTDRAEEAAEFYVSLFPDSRVHKVSRYPEGGPSPGSVMMVEFQLGDQHFVALNGGPHFRFTEAISLAIECETQEEVDHYNERLLADGGEQKPCGWVTDRFGLSWQVTPKILMQGITDPDPEKSKRVMEVMLGMMKIDVAKVKAAYAGA